MAVIVLLLLFSLLDSAKGVEQKFVKHKSDLLLNINTSGISSDSDFSWKFNQTINVVKFNSGQDPNLFGYATRAEFLKKNYSLLIKNMQHKDSGSYTAIVSGEKDFTAAEYQVRVVDPVSPVNLTINSNVSDVCNVSVTCRTQDSLISKTFQCDSKSCSLVSNPDNTATSSTLNVYVQQDYIICNHSNQVSSEQDKIDFKAKCEKKTAHSADITVGVPVSILLVALIIGFGVHIYCKRKRCKITLPQSPHPDENPAEVSPADSPTTTYSTVQFPKRPAPEEESRNNAMPETVYAQINRVPKTDSEDPTLSS